MSTVDLIRTLQAVLPELAKYDHLPALDSISNYGRGVTLGVTGRYASWQSAANLARWAREFEVPVQISLSWLGNSGNVSTSFELADTTIELSESIGTAHAYQLGGVLGKPLTKDEPIIVSADELLATIAKIDPAATS